MEILNLFIERKWWRKEEGGWGWKQKWKKKGSGAAVLGGGDGTRPPYLKFRLYTERDMGKY